jgi:apolipoprotein N-acyltransferase
MVAMRAVETGRPMARAANTGVSAFIDPLGRILQPTPIGLVESDDDRVDAGLRTPAEFRVQDLPVMSGTTPYVVIGDVPAYLAAAFTVGAWAWGLAKGRRARKQQPARA